MLSGTDLVSNLLFVVSHQRHAIRLFIADTAESQGTVQFLYSDPTGNPQLETQNKVYRTVFWVDPSSR